MGWRGRAPGSDRASRACSCPKSRPLPRRQPHPDDQPHPIPTPPQLLAALKSEPLPSNVKAELYASGKRYQGHREKVRGCVVPMDITKGICFHRSRTYATSTYATSTHATCTHATQRAPAHYYQANLSTRPTPHHATPPLPAEPEDGAQEEKAKVVLAPAPNKTEGGVRCLRRLREWKPIFPSRIIQSVCGLAARALFECGSKAIASSNSPRAIRRRPKGVAQ